MPGLSVSRANIVCGGILSSKLETFESSLGSRASGYVPALDGLRAIGILLVFVHHIVTPFVFGGQVGVDVFFVLSGYLITTILLREWDKRRRINFRAFYIRRAIRLYPALLVAVLALFIPGIIFAPSALNYIVENVLAVTYTTPVALQIADGAAKAWRHTWSLGIEEMFYFLWPLLLAFTLRLGLPRAWSAGLAALGGFVMLGFPVVWHLPGNEPLILRAGGLFVGCSLALVLSLLDKPSVHHLIGFSGLAMIAAAASIATIFQADEIAVVLACVGTLATIAHVSSNRSSWLSCALGARPLAYLGRISYELYIWHYPVLVILAWGMKADFFSVAWLAAPVSLALAVVTHGLLKSRVSYWKQRIKSP